jgi:NADH:ubiquinone oxidoreductase subunit 5 (subunit L)/multisubunit Na+/H+ antiporter MnhA subunit/multisubunit Na+/H+ antiporter MnhB subunit
MTVTSHRDNGPAARLSAVVTTAPYLVLAAIGAPVLAGLATMLLPASRKLPRLVLATAGPTASVVLVAAHLGRSGVSTADTPTGSISWVPSLNLDISFLVDGLGAFFALLIAGMGVVVVLYARAYFGHDAASLARFFPTLGFFTSAMLGVVLADHLLLTVLFWEMTSISSFLLIGWDRDDTDAGKRAMQAFFTTGLGGLALLGGVLLFGGHTGIWRWSGLIAEAATLSHDGTVVAAFLLMFVGAATKSAQWPLHDWLPGAMKAPTPVSAYLHSATMVKAGVFLLGRMLPAFGALAPWLPLLVSIGAVTMLLGAVLALHQDDLKKMFAYTTVSHLGLLVAMYGMGGASTADGIRTIDWDLTQIASHALYKAPLFLAVGALAHLAGARRLSQLFGLWHRPGAGTRAAALVLLLSGYALASGPGTVSFVAKELFFAATTRASDLHPLLAVVGVMAIVAAACNVAIFVRLVTTVMGHRSGVGNDSDAPVVSLIQPDRWASMLWAPAAALIALQYLGGLVPSLWNRTFRGIEVNVHDEAFATGLPLVWEPFLHPGIPLLMTAIAITAGVLLGFSGWMRREIVDVHARIWPATYRGILRGGHRLFHSIQTGHVRHYLAVVFSVLTLCVGWAAWADPAMLRPPAGMALFEYPAGLLLGAVVCAAAIALPMVTERVVRVLVLGASGFAVVGLYLVYQAPDLALTQLMFEIISVILFLLVLRLLPRPDRRPRIRVLPRLALASVVGISIGWMTLLAGHAADNRADDAPTLGRFFEEHSLEGSELTDGRGGEGRNVVNVILVDFRGFDTLGEITVLATAALGVWSMLPGRRRHRRDEDEDEDEDPAVPIALGAQR